jgi:hypothetical protein
MVLKMVKITLKVEMDKILANLQKMAPEHKEALAKRGVEPSAFFFRSRAVGRFKKNRQRCCGGRRWHRMVELMQ